MTVTTPIKPIPDEKKLSTYELASVLEACAKSLKDMPLSIIRNVEYEEQEAYVRIENIIKGVNNRLAELEKAMADSDESYVKATDEHYERTGRLISKMNDRLKQLPQIECAFRLPYHANEIFEIAERYSHLSDEQWQRVIELAKAFTPKIEPE
jgi:hypothetical protein